VDEPIHNFYFSTNRYLWLSLIPKEHREEHFPDSEKQIPRKLVTTSVFCEKFWSDRHVNLTTEERNITAERAWFGIRSFVKGSRIADTVAKNGLDSSLFAQLSTAKEEIAQVYRSESEIYFQEDELRTLILIYKKYANWLEKNEYYDEMDIVRSAINYSKGRADIYQENKREIVSLDKSRINEIINSLNMSEETLQYKKDAYRAMKTKKLTKEMKMKYINFVKQWLDGSVRSSPPVGVYGKERLTIYKHRLSGAARLLFSWVQLDGYNRDEPFLLIYNVVFDHDAVNSYIDEKLGKNKIELTSEGTTQNSNPKPERISSIKDTMGTGPTKPSPGKISMSAIDNIDMPHNITLDWEQRRAIVANQPLLVDGLAGTGKTAVLSRRAVFRAGYCDVSTKILCIASNHSVVNRLSSDVSNLMSNNNYWNKQIEWGFQQRLFGIGLDSSEIDTQLKISESCDHHKFKFDEIILDECQDITPLEFDCLKLFAKYNDVKRFSFAGDPLQTLNPTGFDWGRIRNLFVESIGEDLSENERNDIAKELQISKFHQNYRSQGAIVELANSIQRHRSVVLGSKDTINMIPYEDAGEPAHLLQIMDAEDKEAITTALINSGIGNVIVICWATDDHQLIEMCTSEIGDEILKDAWNRQDISEEEQSSFRTKLIIHSSSSIKGGEHTAVLLYKFGSNHDHKLDSLLKEHETISKVEQIDQIPVSYAYSRLYVAVTRAFRNVYFAEDKDGIDFWNKVKIKNMDQSSLFSKVQSAKAVKTIGDFLLDDELTWKNFKKYNRIWREDRDKNALFAAIRIMRHLIATNDDKGNSKTLAELEGDKALYFDENSAVAEDKYKLAGKKSKYLPLMYKRKAWMEIFEEIGESQVPFDVAMKLFCEFKSNSSTTIEDLAIVSFKEIIDKLDSTDTAFTEYWKGCIEFEDFISALKRNYLKMFFRYTSNIGEVTASNKKYVDFFTFEIIREMLKKKNKSWVFAGEYVRFIDKYGKDQKPKFDKTKDFTYAKSLEEGMRDLSGEEKVQYIEEHLSLVSKEIQAEWKRILCKAVDKIILDLPPKGFEPQSGGKMSFEIHKNKKPTQTQKLFDLLAKRQLNADESEGYTFRDAYSWCIEHILLARNQVSEIDKYISLVKALESPKMIGDKFAKQVSWMNEDKIPITSIWVNSQMGNITKFSNKSDLKDLLDSAMAQARYYNKNKLWPGSQIFNKPMQLINDHYEDGEPISWYIFSNLGGSIIEMIEKKLGGMIVSKSGEKEYSWFKLAEMVSSVVINHRGEIDEKLIKRMNTKTFKGKISLLGKAHLNLRIFTDTPNGKKLLKEMNGTNPISNKNMGKYIELLRKAELTEEADEASGRIMIDATTAVKQLGETKTIKDWIDKYHASVKGLGNNSFFELEMFENMLKKSVKGLDLGDSDPFNKTNQEFTKIPSNVHALSEIWSEFADAQRGKKSEFELVEMILSNIDDDNIPKLFLMIEHVIAYASLKITKANVTEELARSLQWTHQKLMNNAGANVDVPTGKTATEEKIALAYQKQAALHELSGYCYTKPKLFTEERLIFLVIIELSKKSNTYLKSLHSSFGLKGAATKKKYITGICEYLGGTNLEEYNKFISNLQ